MVLLGIRTSLLVYGTIIHLSGELLVSASSTAPCSAQDFAALLRCTMSDLQPVQPRSSHGKTFVHQDLNNCTHVFVRVDTVRKLLQPPYQGPCAVIRRTRKIVTIDCNGIPDSVAVERFVPAQLLHAINPTTPAIRPVRFRSSYHVTRGGIS